MTAHQPRAVERSPRKSPVRLVLLSVGIALALLLIFATLWPLSNDENRQRLRESFAADHNDANEPPRINDDPRQDGWKTEAFSGAAEQQLGKLAKGLLASRATTDVTGSAALNGLLGSEFQSAALRPKSLQVRFEDHGLIVRRPALEGAAGESTGQLLYRGPNGLLQSWQSLAEWLGAGADIDLQLKIFRVELLPGNAAADRQGAPQGEAMTDVLFTIRATSKSQRRQAQGVWRCHWTWSAQSPDPHSPDPHTPDAQSPPVGKSGMATEARSPATTSAGIAPLLRRIEIREYEEVEARGRWQFVDCTEAALAGNDCYAEQIVPGLDHWLERAANVFDRTRIGGLGLAVGDVNGDGRDDLYLCDQGALPNRLFLQGAGGRLTDVSRTWGVDWLDQSTCGLLVDLDNDGDQDLVVGTKTAVLMMENDENRQFQLREKRSELADVYSLSAADYDNDGLLDIYVCCYSKEGYDQVTEYASPVPYHDATNGGANALIRNEGEWRFRDVSQQCGLEANNHRWSFAAGWEDFDNDGDLDLYVANDYGPNSLYRNDDGAFLDIAAAAGVEDFGAGMSVVWSDYNHDGWIDLYVSNMFSTAGSRIAHQQKFKPDAPPQVRAAYQRMAKGNTLFENRGDGTFKDVSHQAAVARARWAWGTAAVDVNNDSWEDLIVANGYITGTDTRDL